MKSPTFVITPPHSPPGAEAEGEGLIDEGVLIGLTEAEEESRHSSPKEESSRSEESLHSSHTGKIDADEKLSSSKGSGYLSLLNKSQVMIPLPKAGGDGGIKYKAPPPNNYPGSQEAENGNVSEPRAPGST